LEDTGLPGWERKLERRLWKREAEELVKGAKE
jgi:hypothetical protein